MLCEICKRVFYDSAISLRGYQWEDHHDLQNLYESSSGGCRLCTIVSSSLTPAQRARILAGRRGRISTGHFLGGSAEVTFSYRNTVKYQLDEQVIIAVKHEDEYLPTDQPYLLAGGPCTEEYDSTEGALSFISDNLLSCLEKHADCRYSLSGDAQLPMRLLKTSDIDIDGKIYIVTSTSLPRDTPYVTLTHRWGGSCDLVLTERSLEALSGTGIASQDLPPTFRDAAIVTQKLGISYLWIDALCIIQGAHSGEWLTEAGRMSDIYANSICNLAAPASENASGGLFRIRHAWKAFEVKPTSEQASKGYRPMYVFSKSLWSGQVLDAPLNARAWVLQERVLSPRTVHFGSSRVFWECRTSSVTEAVPAHLKESALPPGTDIKRNFFRQLITSQSHEEKNKHLLLESWRDIVELYSNCGLTVASDKLIAIHGLALAIESHLPDHSKAYIHGVWTTESIRELLWTVDCRGSFYESSAAFEPISGGRNDDFPSWSWASIPQAIRYLRPPKRAMIEHVLADPGLDISLEKEQVASREVSMQFGGKVLKLLLARNEQGNVEVYYEETLLEGHIHLDEPLDLPERNRSVKITVSWMPLMETQPKFESFKVFGLLMVPISESEAQYRRVGLFVLHQQYGCLEPLEELSSEAATQFYAVVAVRWQQVEKSMISLV